MGLVNYDKQAIRYWVWVPKPQRGQASRVKLQVARVPILGTVWNVPDGVANKPTNRCTRGSSGGVVRQYADAADVHGRPTSFEGDEAINGSLSERQWPSQSSAP